MLLLLETAPDDTSAAQAEIDDVIASLRNMQDTTASAELPPELNELPDIDLDDCRIRLTCESGQLMLEIIPNTR